MNLWLMQFEWFDVKVFPIQWLNEDRYGWFKDTPAEGGTLQKLKGVLPTCVTISKTYILFQLSA